MNNITYIANIKVHSHYFEITFDNYFQYDSHISVKVDDNFRDEIDWDYWSGIDNLYTINYTSLFRLILNHGITVLKFDDDLLDYRNRPNFISRIPIYLMINKII